MANLFLIGVCHNDPFGAEKTQNALRLARENSFIPDCIAVEWRSDYAHRVILQRDTFGRLLTQEYPDISDKELHTLQSSLAFEADAHLEIYPEIPIVWLDENRTVIDEIIEKYAEDRLSIIKSAVRKNNGEFNLCNISYCMRQSSNNVAAPSERDEVFFSCIQETVASGYRNIACVVGTNHTKLSTKGMFGELLKNEGHSIMIYKADEETPILMKTGFMTV
jgi:hypothetical protein